MSSDHEMLYDGKFVQMLRCGRWEYARRTGGVSGVGIIAVTDDNRLVIVEQFRIPVGTNTLELPAGIVGDGHGEESIESAGRRELLEETGYSAGHVEYLWDGPSSAGLTDEMVHLVHATGLKKEHAGGGVDEENITVHEIPLSDLESFLASRRKQGTLIDFKIRLAACFLNARAAR